MEECQLWRDGDCVEARYLELSVEELERRKAIALKAEYANPKLEKKLDITELYYKYLFPKFSFQLDPCCESPDLQYVGDYSIMGVFEKCRNCHEIRIRRRETRDPRAVGNDAALKFVELGKRETEWEDTSDKWMRNVKQGYLKMKRSREDVLIAEHIVTQWGIFASRHFDCECSNDDYDLNNFTASFDDRTAPTIKCTRCLHESYIDPCDPNSWSWKGIDHA